MEWSNRITWCLLIAFLLGTSCKKENNDQELIEKEKRLLKQYLADNNITQEPTASGMYYIVTEPGTGEAAVPHGWVDIRYTGRLVNGTVFETNIRDVAIWSNIYDEGLVYGMTRLYVTNITMEGLKEGVQYMTEGEKAKLIIPSDLGIGGDSRLRIPPYSTLIFDIELLNTFTDPEENQREEIVAYLGDPQSYTDTTREGIYYFESEKGWGDTIRDGDEVYIYYTGKFLDGRIFFSNLNDPYAEIIYYKDQDDVIPGIMAALKYMRGGAEAEVIIPYWHGYGSKGAENSFGQVLIPPYMPLSYKIIVDNVF